MALKSSVHYVSGSWGYRPSRTNGGTDRQIGWRDDLLVSASNNPRGNNPFHVQHRTTTGSVINGVGGSYGYTDYPSAFYAFGYDADGEITEADGRRGLALTNPSRPTVLLPVFISELRDIPEMVRQVGGIGIAMRDAARGGIKNALSKAKNPTAALAAVNLGYQFGWRPLVQDLWTMLTFQDAVDQRQKELKKLREGGLRRVVKLRTSSYSTGDIRALGEGFNSVPITYRYHTVVTSGVVWKQTYEGSANIPEGRAIGPLRRQLLGLSPDQIAANVWEALPWSWFTDYFNNIGDMIQAGNRTIATPERAWVKHVTTCEASHPTVVGPTGSAIGGLTLSAGHTKWKRVMRSPSIGPGAPSEIAHIPNLGGGQLSILGSLAVVKNRRVLRGL